MIKKFFRALKPAQIFTAGFFILIFLGGFLLSLPISSATGESTPFFGALFTSVSATCITGLVVFDTFTHWSLFGQAVILFLIQTGGLGFMTLATMFSLFFRRAVGHRERLLLAQTLNLDDAADVVRLSKHILLGTFAFEGAAALVLTVRFIPDYGFAGGLWRGVFVSISAFCNAGFDLMGKDAPFSSLTAYSGDLTVNLTVMALIVIGGLGFLVWGDILTARSFSKMSLQSRVVLVFSGVLIVGGALLIFILEYTNPETLSSLPFGEKLLCSLFQSVSPRTAGFNTVELSSLRELTQLLMTALMFIGGSSGSTAGGVKTNTIAILFYSTVSVLRGRSEVTINKRRIATAAVLRAFALVSLSLILLLVSSFIVSAVEGVTFVSALFECTSAFCTVGLTLGITPALSYFSLTLLMLLMFLGRIGLITVSMTLFLKQQRTENRLRYPEAHIAIG